MYKQELLKKKQELLNLIMKLEDDNKSKQEGRLRIMVDGNKVKYFHITEHNDTKGKYIKKKDMELAAKLAKTDYNEKLLKEARLELKTIEHFLDSYNPDNLGEIYASMHPERQKLVMPIAVTDKEYVRRWISAPYESNPFRKEELRYETVRGDMVRTKSEAMIANMYYELGIPYKYEYPVKVKSGAIKYPDFVLLNVHTREEIYHEHMGLLVLMVSR